MDKTYLISQLVVPILCYIIGVICGRRSVLYKEDLASEFDEETEIAHVSYTPEQMGYDK